MMKLRKTYKKFILKQNKIFHEDFKFFMSVLYEKSLKYLSSPEVSLQDKRSFLVELNLEKKFFLFLLYLSHKKHILFLKKVYKDLLLHENIFSDREEIYKAGLKVYKDGAILDLTPQGIINYLKVRL